MESTFSEIFFSQSKKPLVGIDIGSSFIKFAEVQLVENEKPLIRSLGKIKLPSDIFTGAIPTKKEQLSDLIFKLFEQHQVETKRVAFSLPSSAVFTKIISLSKSDAENLDSTIAFEASNYIPHRIDAINLDYQIIDNSGSMTEVLLVAVKHDILNAYREVFQHIGIEPVIADVDSFCCQNAFEMSVDSFDQKTVGIIDLGFRHMSVTLAHKGKYVLSGDMGVGIKQYIDALIESLEISPEQAENYLIGENTNVNEAIANETRDRVSENIISEITKQIEFFWNGAEIDKNIDEIWITGGGANVANLPQEISTALKLPCHMLNASSVFTMDEAKSSMSEKEKVLYNLALSLSTRRLSDKENVVAKS